MLFNAPEFVFVFLPVVLALYYGLGRLGRAEHAMAALVAASLFFYGWWSPIYLALILCSVGFNYACGRRLGREDREAERPESRRLVLGLGVAVNLGLLGYFKYANFFVDNLNLVAGSDWNLERVVLPLAISFFTFQQIAFLVDTYRQRKTEQSLVRYCLFVTFFPQLIAGPIVHHGETLPQFARPDSARLKLPNLAVGATLFAIGLFKKAVIADGVALHATPVFAAAAAGQIPTTAEAWVGVLAYTLQLYFDFSGYSDMAIGLGRMFGIRLPLNFDSPYKARNIVDFWRRWHITLSRFLRDYLYIPLGGNRKGKVRRYTNLMTTMLLGGLWHGAGWTFVIWGGLHGLYLVINHAWSALRVRLGLAPSVQTLAGVIAARALTLAAVMLGWVFFRAADAASATRLLGAMVGLDGAPAGGDPFANRLVTDATGAIVALGIGLALALWAPNTQELMAEHEPALGFDAHRSPTPRWPWLRWRPSPVMGALVGGLLFAWFLTLFSADVSEFLYFQF